MPQYTNTLEQFRTPEKLPVGWPWRLLVFALIVFAFMVAIYFGMVFGYTPYLNSQANSLDKQINSLSQSVNQEQQKNLANFYSQLINVQTLLASHQNPSKLFDFLEKNTNQNVYYQSLELAAAEKTLKLTGNASDYNILVQQLELFRRDPRVESVFLDSSGLGATGGTDFSIRVIFKPELMSENATSGATSNATSSAQ
jgi:lipopolysaccharide export LptBFGC system permease protein LptF